MTDTDFDVIVIGGGAAGLTVAVGGAGLGLRVALVERHRLGGECTWTGCVPSKALLHVAGLVRAARELGALGAPEDPSTSAPLPPLPTEARFPDSHPPEARLFHRAMAHVRGARERIARTEDARALRARGITALQGEARLLPPTSSAPGRCPAVAVDGPPGGGTYRARHVVLATGSTPAVPPVPGLADTRYLTNETLFDSLDALPPRLAVIGGGPVGCEMAQAFARLGSTVTLIQSGPRLLPQDDPDASAVLREALEADGVTVRTGTRLTRAAPDPDGSRGATLHLEGLHPIPTDAVLVSAGRRPRTEGLGLEEAGVRVGEDGIAVDSYLRTSRPGVWAVGDCAGPYRFTHMADVQGRAVLRNILFPWLKRKVDYRVVPWATFTDPEVAHVGLTEPEARQRHGRGCAVVHLPLERVDRAVTDGATRGFIKLVLRGQTLLGAQVVAPRGAELIQELALVMERRLPVGALSMVHVYPAYSYGLHQANDAYWSRSASGGALGRVALPLLRRAALA